MTRGEAPFQRRGLAQIFRAAHTGRKAIYQAGLQQSKGALPKGLPLPARG